jgi:hypothetical protein
MNVLAPRKSSSTRKSSSSAAAVNVSEIGDKENTPENIQVEPKKTAYQKTMPADKNTESESIEREAHRKNVQARVNEYKKQREHEKTFASPMRFFKGEQREGSGEGMSRTTKVTVIFVLGVIIFSAARVFLTPAPPISPMKIVSQGENLAIIDIKTGLSPTNPALARSLGSGSSTLGSHSSFSLISADQHRRSGGGGGGALRSMNPFRAGIEKLQSIAGSVGRLLKSLVRTVTGRR